MASESAHNNVTCLSSSYIESAMQHCAMEVSFASVGSPGAVAGSNRNGTSFDPLTVDRLHDATSPDTLMEVSADDPPTVSIRETAQVVRSSTETPTMDRLKDDLIEMPSIGHTGEIHISLVQAADMTVPAPASGSRIVARHLGDVSRDNGVPQSERCPIDIAIDTALFSLSDVLDKVDVVASTAGQQFDCPVSTSVASIAAHQNGSDIFLNGGTFVVSAGEQLLSGNEGVVSVPPDPSKLFLELPPPSAAQDIAVSSSGISLSSSDTSETFHATVANQLLDIGNVSFESTSAVPVSVDSFLNDVQPHSDFLVCVTDIDKCSTLNPPTSIPTSFVSSNESTTLIPTNRLSISTLLSSNGVTLVPSIVGSIPALVSHESASIFTISQSPSVSSTCVVTATEPFSPTKVLVGPGGYLDVDRLNNICISKSGRIVDLSDRFDRPEKSHTCDRLEVAETVELASTEEVHSACDKVYIASQVLTSGFCEKPPDEPSALQSVADSQNVCIHTSEKHFAVETIRSMTNLEPYSDAILVSSDGTKFQVHRLVLVTASAFFAKLFRGRCSCGGEGEDDYQPVHIHLDEIETDVVRSLLTVLYTGQVKCRSFDDKERLMHLLGMLQIDVRKHLRCDFVETQTALDLSDLSTKIREEQREVVDVDRSVDSKVQSFENVTEAQVPSEHQSAAAAVPVAETDQSTHDYGATADARDGNAEDSDAADGEDNNGDERKRSSSKRKKCCDNSSHGKRKKYRRPSERAFSCFICLASFYKKSHLQDHEMTHITSKVHTTCTECKITCKNMRLLIIHLRQKHKRQKSGELIQAHINEVMKSIKSPCLDFDTFDPDELMSANEIQLGCNDNDDGNGNEGSGAETHTGEKRRRDKKFECVVCLKRFYERAHCNRHQLIHITDEQFTTCQVCQKRCVNVSVLVDHLKEKHGMKFDKDSLPGATPDDSSNRSSTNGPIIRAITTKDAEGKPTVIFQRERRFACDVCGMKFFKRGHLKDHEMIHVTDDDLTTCGHCQKKCSNQRTLQIHLKREHRDLFVKTRYTGPSLTDDGDNVEDVTRQVNDSSDRIFSCGTCPMSFKSRAHLNEHQLTHVTDPDLTTCNICHKQLKNRRVLIRHLKDHSRPDVVAVDIPDEDDNHNVDSPLPSNSNDNNETSPPAKKTKTVLIEKPFSCPRCLRTFYTRGHLEEHQKIHDQPQDRIVCKLCRAAFKSRAVLRHHMKTLHNVVEPDLVELKTAKQRSAGDGGGGSGVTDDARQHSCSQCSKRFSTHVALRNHTRTHVTDAESTTCRMCGKRFSNLQVLLTHIGEVHKRGRTRARNEPSECTVCRKRFNSRKLMLRHRKLHTDARRFKCNMCQAAFPQWTQLRFHKLGHTKEKPLKCPHCDERFRDYSNRKYHVQMKHSALRPFVCAVCNQGFVSKHRLNSHAISHSSVRQFGCGLCTSTFKTVLDQKRHLIEVHEEPTNLCGMCGQVFRRKRALKNHIEKHHLLPITDAQTEEEEEDAAEEVQLEVEQAEGDEGAASELRLAVEGIGGGGGGADEEDIELMPLSRFSHHQTAVDLIRYTSGAGADARDLIDDDVPFLASYANYPQLVCNDGDSDDGGVGGGGVFGASANNTDGEDDDDDLDAGNATEAAADDDATAAAAGEDDPETSSDVFHSIFSLHRYMNQSSLI